MRETPPDPLLAEAYAVIRGNPAIWQDLDPDLVTSDSESLIQLTYFRISQQENTKAGPFWKRISRKLALPVAGIFIMGSSSFVTAQVLKVESPRTVSNGILCRAEATENSDAVVLEATADPISACRNSWATGSLAQHRGNKPLPALVACISTKEITEVLPGNEETCVKLGLSVANVELSSEQKTIISLQEMMIEQVNSKCLEKFDGQRAIKKILTELHLSEWSTFVDGSPSIGPCSVAQIFEESKLVLVFSFEERPVHKEARLNH